MNLGGLAPELARARQQSHGLERGRLQQQSELVQQKARQQRHRLEQESVRLRTDIRDHKFVARERAFEDGQATKAERELIRPTLASHPNSWSRHHVPTTSADPHLFLVRFFSSLTAHPRRACGGAHHTNQGTRPTPGASGRASPRSARPSTTRCGGARRPSVATRMRRGGAPPSARAGRGPSPSPSPKPNPSPSPNPNPNPSPDPSPNPNPNQAAPTATGKRGATTTRLPSGDRGVRRLRGGL
jgi:hypothetical protein